MIDANQGIAAQDDPGRGLADAGPTLREILDACKATHQPLPEGAIVLVARGVLLELAACHATGRVHGRVTPDHIRLSDQRGFFLEDPATASAREPEASGASRLLYVAPEAVMEGICLPASDVFATGIVVWECLLGQHPFRYADNEPLAETLWHIAHDAPLVPAGAGGRVSDRGLLAFASAMLAKDPSGRPSAQVLLQAIRATNRPAMLALPEATTMAGLGGDSQRGPPRE